MCFVCIDESERGVKQCNGRYQETLGSGCHAVAPCCMTIRAVNMKVVQLEVHTDTKTKDDVTVRVSSAVQWHVDPEMVETFHFKVSNPHSQITAFVDDIIRSELPIRTLDEAFAEKDKMGKATEDHLRADISKTFGITVDRVLITDLQPDAKVQRSMNEINAAKREREAARERAEAQRVLTVVAAEAERDARQLSGQGLALMRREIASGFKNSIVDLTGQTDEHLNAQAVVHMMLVTQYLDVLKDFAHSGGSSMVIPHGAGVISDIENQVKMGLDQAKLKGTGAPAPAAAGFQGVQQVRL